jgi:hypothetical protein
VTKAAARTVANVVLVSAGVAAAYVMVTSPPLRRLAGLATRRWLGASLPMFLLSQVGRAWRQSQQRAPAPDARLDSPSSGAGHARTEDAGR